MTERTILFEVFGKVQGVFFRKYTQKKALELDLAGWCLNTDRKSVQGAACGEAAAIAAFSTWLSEPSARPSQRSSAPRSSTRRTSVSSPSRSRSEDDALGARRVNHHGVLAESRSLADNHHVEGRSIRRMHSRQHTHVRQRRHRRGSGPRAASASASVDFALWFRSFLNIAPERSSSRFASRTPSGLIGNPCSSFSQSARSSK